MLCTAHLPHDPAVWCSNPKMARKLVGKLLGLQDADKQHVMPSAYPVLLCMYSAFSTLLVKRCA